MRDPFIEQQWAELCDHVRKCANQIAQNESERSDYEQQADEFASTEPPTRYHELLEKTAEASRLAVHWQTEEQEASIDEAGNESFPASDPPSFSHAHA